MARVVDAKALLDAFGAQELLEEYDIADGFAAWNNHAGGNEKSLNAEELAHLVHCGAGRRDTEIGRYFVPRKTCIFEAY
jgi:hypothetical protein